MDHAEFGAWLRETPPDAAISLYLHVPYCRDICWYCGCNTYAARRTEPIATYVETVYAEIDLVADMLGGKRVTEIHWGGGTPNILSPEQFSHLVAKLSERFDLRRLVRHAVEIDPRTFSADMARTLSEAGVNRVSLGVQDLNEHVQRVIGRVQQPAVVQRAVDLLRNHRLMDISIDLMYGLPDQTIGDLRDTIALVAAMKPNRISLFGYAQCPGSRSGKG
ncbi:MAG: radical SAM protein [Hyphomonadaceae bacterium]|nr:radical SAM protein [Hyphomonadaceae bacterium]